MSLFFILMAITIGAMGMFGNIGYGEIIGFASLLVTILIFYSNAVNKQRKYNTEHELKITNIYSDLLELKTRDKELDLKIKELDTRKMDIAMCEKMNSFTASSIGEVKEDIKELRSQITNNHNELLTKIK